MLISRKIMHNSGIKEADSAILLKKANQYIGVRVFDKMGTDKNDRIIPIPHFDLDDMIEAQKRFLKACGSNNVVRNKALLAMLEELKKHLLEKNNAIN